LANSSTVCLHTRSVIATLLSLQSLKTALIDFMSDLHAKWWLPDQAISAPKR